MGVSDRNEALLAGQEMDSRSHRGRSRLLAWALTAPRSGDWGCSTRGERVCPRAGSLGELARGQEGQRLQGVGAEAGVRAGGDRVCGQSSSLKKLFNPGKPIGISSYSRDRRLWCSMSRQSIPGSKGEQERSVNKSEGLTPGERQRLEESMRRNEKLMKRLAEM